MVRCWFSFSENGDGFRLHDTEAEAKTAAHKEFQCEQDDAIDGWSDEVTSICWGKLSECVIEKSRHKPDPEEGESTRFDEIIEYALEPPDARA